MENKLSRRLLSFALLCSLPLAGLERADAAPQVTSRDARALAAPAQAKEHKHNFVKVEVGKEWVPPKTAKKIVGYDEKGKPIYEEVVVSPGFYRKLFAEKCSICGKVKKS